MALEYKDYYEILGVTRSAGGDEIRRAFRRLARAYHPDRTSNDAQAEERFKEINEAYEVLCDPLKRQRYDTFQANWRNYGFAEQGRFGSATADAGMDGETARFSFTGAGFSEFFDGLFGQRTSDTIQKEEGRSSSDDRKGDDL